MGRRWGISIRWPPPPPPMGVRASRRTVPAGPPALEERAVHLRREGRRLDDVLHPDRTAVNRSVWRGSENPSGPQRARVRGDPTGVPKARRHSAHAPEYRRHMAALVRSARSVACFSGLSRDARAPGVSLGALDQVIVAGPGGGHARKLPAGNHLGIHGDLGEHLEQGNVVVLLEQIIEDLAGDSVPFLGIE